MKASKWCTSPSNAREEPVEVKTQVDAELHKGICCDLARDCCRANSRRSKLKLPVCIDCEEVRCNPSSVLAPSSPISLQDGKSEVALATNIEPVNGEFVLGHHGAFDRPLAFCSTAASAAKLSVMLVVQSVQAELLVRNTTWKKPAV